LCQAYLKGAQDLRRRLAADAAATASPTTARPAGLARCTLWCHLLGFSHPRNIYFKRFPLPLTSVKLNGGGSVSPTSLASGLVRNQGFPSKKGPGPHPPPQHPTRNGGGAPFRMGFYTEIVRMQAEKVRRRGLGADGDKLLQYIARNGPEPGPPAHSRTPPPHPLGREGAGIPPPAGGRDRPPVLRPGGRSPAEAADPGLFWLLSGEAYGVVAPTPMPSGGTFWSRLFCFGS